MGALRVAPNQNMRTMSKEEELELREAIANLVEEEPEKTIKVKKAKQPEERVAVNILPSHEGIVRVLRELDIEDFRKVIKAAKQYRRADKTLGR